MTIKAENNRLAQWILFDVFCFFFILCLPFLGVLAPWSVSFHTLEAGMAILENCKSIYSLYMILADSKSTNKNISNSKFIYWQDSTTLPFCDKMQIYDERGI